MILCGFDLETPQDKPEYGLQPWRAASGEATIKSYAAFSEDKKLKQTKWLPSKDDLAQFLEVCIDRQCTITGWNVMFDVAWLHSIGLTELVKRCRWLDGMLLLKRVDPWRAKEEGGKGFGLKAAVAEEWPQYAGYEIDATKVPQTPEEIRELLQYNFYDVVFTMQLARKYLGLLSHSERQGAYLEAASIPDVALSYVHGIHINTDALEPFRIDVEKRIAEAVPIIYGEKEVFNSEVSEVLSIVKSPKKLATMLFDTWGYAPIKKTPAGAPATDKESLLKLSIEHPEDIRFKALMDLRKCNTQKSKFVEGVSKSIAYHGEPIVRPQPIIAGTLTGRFTYSSSQGTGKGKCQTGIALHQWERGKPARDLLAAPPGYLLAEFDFSGQELRLMAILAEDEVMLELFTTGGDGHAYMGASIENLDYDWVRLNHDTDARAKAARNLGKFATLSLMYRIGVDTMMVRALTQYGLQLWRAKAQHIKDTYLRTYKRVPQYWKMAIEKAAKQGYAESMGHRRLPLDNLSIYAQQQNAINHPIQGSGGDMKALGLAVCANHFNSDLIYGWDLHDALFVYVKDDAKVLGKVLMLKELLSNLPYEKAWGWHPTIPLPVDAKMGKTWGTLKGV